jgi:hypothetical protein
MLPFPFSASGTVSVRSDAPDVHAVMDAVEQAFGDVRASAVQRTRDSIAFRGGVFRLVTSWNILGPISSGILRFTRGDHGVDIDYRLSFVQMFIIVTVMLAALKLGSWPWGQLGTRTPWLPLFIGWCWLFGVNYLITVFHFPAFLRTAANRAATQDAHAHATRNV